MALPMPALEAYALTKSRQAADGGMRLWRIPDIVVQAGQTMTVQAQEPSEFALLLGMLSGLTPVDGGVLRLRGESAEDLSRLGRARLRARTVGFVYSAPKLLPDLSVLDNVALPLSVREEAGSPLRQATGTLRGPLTPRQIEPVNECTGPASERPGNRHRAQAVLDQLEIGHLAHRRPPELTTLEGQLVALARALVSEPALVLADEPTAELGGTDADAFLMRLRGAARERGCAVVLCTARASVAGWGDNTVVLHHDPQLLRPRTHDVGMADFWSDLYGAEVAPLVRPVAPVLELVARPLVYTSIVALLIVFLTFFGLRMARSGQYAGDLERAVSLSISESRAFISRLFHGDLGAYRWQQSTYNYWDSSRDRPIAELLRRTLDKSLALLLLSLLLAAVVGVPLGLAAAVMRHRKFSLVFVTAAIVGVSTPSFFLALLLQILEINIYRRTGVALFPVGGFGWDSHIVLPALVLAARPVAQVARISFVALSEALDADYVRTARAKGLNSRAVIFDHALQNAGVPILSTLGSSLRFSVSSLPIVEALFNWPGMGSLLLIAISTEANLAATLTLVLGILFVLVQVVLDNLYRWVDPRLREQRAGLHVQRSWLDMVEKGWSGVRGLPERAASFLPWVQKQRREELPPLPALNGTAQRSADEQKHRDAKIRQERRRAWAQSTLGSLPFVLGATILLALLAAVVWGQGLAPHSPYSPTSSQMVNGELRFAPFPPSAVFPLGTDTLGRDILTQLLYGARRTLSLAFFAVIARILLGTILGALSGWFADSLLDRVVLGLTQVLAAFPTLLLAMILIYAFGIQQGVRVFALALSLVGWGEAAQFVRGQVMHIREQDYVEGALAVGLGDIQLLARHVLPNLVPSLVILACLEMGGVLMLLGELGFVGVFIGGGWATRSATDAAVKVFDVPEWGAMLANTWRSFRSQPWMTFYPALAFTTAIVGFNLFGEGLRRLTERLTLSMHRIINRYTVGAALGLGVLLVLASESTGSWAQYVNQARRFGAERAMQDVRFLASPQMKGRGIETPELQTAADYIAQQFANLGLQPAGSDKGNGLSYFADTRLDYQELASAPVLQLSDSAGQQLGPFVYRQDYAEMHGRMVAADLTRTEVVCLSMDPLAESWPKDMQVQPGDLTGKIVLFTAAVPYAFSRGSFAPAGVLVVEDDSEALQRRELVSRSSGDYSWWGGNLATYLLVSPRVANAILAPSGHSVEELRSQRDKMGANEGFAVRTGVDANVHMKLTPMKTAALSYIQGFVPGNDDELDNELVLLLAHYDGQGADLDGTPYPGANRNASGVAVMLEVARLLKETNYQPRRTILYVAWAGAELRAPVDLVDILRARIGFLENYRLAAVIELTSLGAGSDALLLERSQSGRLTEAFQQAGRRLNVQTATVSRFPDPYGSTYPTPDRKIPYIRVTWDGSQQSVHTPADTVEKVSADKLHSAGSVVALTTMYLAHEKAF